MTSLADMPHSSHDGLPPSSAYSKVQAMSLRVIWPCCTCCCRGAAKGEQVSLSYSPLPNLKLLLFYGFALPDNPQDTASMTFQVCLCGKSCVVLVSGCWCNLIERHGADPR